MMAQARLEITQPLLAGVGDRGKMNNDQVRVAFSSRMEWKKVKDEDSIVPNAGLGTTGEIPSPNPELEARV